MTIKNKLLKLFTLAAGITAGSAACAAGGDIFEIRPCTQEGLATPAYATIDSPLTSGESVYFKIRLIQRTIGAANSVWKIEHIGASSEVVDDALYPLQVGIYVSGQLRYASLIDATSDATTGFTDLVFEYKTRAGDFALPIVLATSDGPASDSDTSLEYLLNPARTGKWTITNDAGNTCKFYYWTPDRPASSPDGTRMTDYSLADCGFYVQTIGFDKEWESEDFWRTVHQNSSITVGGTPSLEAAAAPEDAVTLYVWSMDDNVVKVRGGTVQNMITGYDASHNPIRTSTQVGTVTLAGGQLKADFAIEGVKEGDTTKLVLSPWDHYTFKTATGARIVDYITVPVKCIEPMPPTAIVEADRLVAYADGNYMTYGALLSVYLSQAYQDGPVDVKIKPSFADGAAADWGDYIRFSTTQDEVTALPPGGPGNEITVRIPAGSTAKQQIYVFCLRGDSHTTGTSRMVFTPEVLDATAATVIHEVTAAGMEIRAAAPVITTPAEGAKISGICGDEMPFIVAVSDTFADSSFQDTTGASGYKIYIKYRGSDAYTLLDGFYYVGEGNALYRMKDDGTQTGTYFASTDLPIIKYPGSGEGLASEVYVVSPLSGKKSEVVHFVADIKEARTSNVVTTDDKNDIYYEGEKATFQISISEKNDTGSTIYAFLLASDNAEAAMFSATPNFVVCNDTDLTKTSGLAINNYQDKTSASKIMFLDGLSEDAGGLSLTFQVVLCSTKNYDPTKRLAGYDSNYLNITVYNLEPQITRIEMNGFESESDGAVFPNKVPKGMTQEFKAIVSDKGKYDLTNTAEPFQCKWTATLAGVGAIKNDVIAGDPSKNPFSYDFPRAGDWTIKLQVKDKDMEDWSDVTYSVGVTVLDNPQVEVIAPEALVENDHSGKIQVQLSYWDPLFTDKLKVRVTVEEYSPGRANPGELKLDSNYSTGVNTYEVEIGDALPVDLMIEAMDGTEVSSLYGFVIKTEVISTDVLPTSHTPANEYYVEDSARVLINNVEPVCMVSPAENTNRYEVAGGVAKNHGIRWQVKSDVDADFAGIPTFKGIKVSFSGCANATEFFVNESTSDTFYPDFGSSQGDQDVVLTIEDKDGGYLTWTWQFTVTPSKFLTTVSTGPSGGTTTSALSQKYTLCDGIGMGHTYVADAIFSSAQNFRLKWNCSKNIYMDIYGFGYKVASPNDDGTLDGMDIALDKFGSASAGSTVTDPFHYPMADFNPDDKEEAKKIKDSYFYCWILHSVGESGNGVTSSILGNSIAPERPGVVGTGSVMLPTEKTEDGSYLDTVVEAIFAQEWLPADNLGDINQDGVPDVFVVKDWKGGKLINLVYGTEDIESDIKALNASNPDDDYLPGVFDQEGVVALVENSRNSYAPVGVPFNTRLELRGLDDGLNATDLTASDVSFSEDEQKAWEAFANANGFDPDTPDLAIWSPEPRSARYSRMDPTLDDTDGDRFPDGWEYYFWYQAHVWAPAGKSKPRAGQQFAFERFRVFNILVGEEIPAAEVEKRFNPCDPLPAKDYADHPDFDNDGLSDLEELVLGTNPCHWDTDGDHMCDGWEVMYALDPLNGSKNGNPDGDFMAFFNTLGVPCYVDPNAPIQDSETPGFEFLICNRLRPIIDYDQLSGTIVRDLTTIAVHCKAKADPEDPGKVLRYGLGPDVDGPPANAEPEVLKDWVWSNFMVEDIYRVEIKLVAGDRVNMFLPYTLIHDQVHTAFGYDPRTAWYKNGEGYVASRWDPMINKELMPFDTTGVAINTRPYETYDEYLVMKYRSDYNIIYYLKEPGFNNPWATMLAKTTNPNVVFPTVEVEVTETTEEVSADGTTTNTIENTTVQTVVQTNETTIIAQRLAEALAASGSSSTVQTGHGADTDGDGVPDGWELYTYRCPNAAPTVDDEKHPKKEIDFDYDADKLNYTDEFAGTDSCNAYRNCATIYANHPGNLKGWFNKFFPTNPGTWLGSGIGNDDGKDTDGDGLTDFDEGQAWCANFFYEGKMVLEAQSSIFSAGAKAMGFIYGEPQDSITCCVRGGGLNPCTVDTDQDWLPDAWEAAHAGLPVDLATRQTVAPVNGDKLADFEFGDSTWIADGIYGVEGLTGVYIAGGMDGTWPGDYCTGDSSSVDELLGKVTRDVDFDHDGLQNYQEYFVQGMRHFRWDEISTPLMGRILEEGDRVMGNLVTVHEQQFANFTQHDFSDPGQLAVNSALAWGSKELVKTITVTNGTSVTYDYIDPLNPAAGLVTNITYYTERKRIYVGGNQLIDDRIAGKIAKAYSAPWSDAGFRALGYMSAPAHEWDRSFTALLLSNPTYLFPITGSLLVDKAMIGYVSTDPRMPDTDMDGMDDYYELFHGLNPLLGQTTPGYCDLLYDKYGDIIAGTYYAIGFPLVDSRPVFNAFFNEWTHPNFDRRLPLGSGAIGTIGALAHDCYNGVSRNEALSGPEALDPMLYPWVMGCSNVDCDGDGLRNFEEQLLANAADPQPLNTDPTPQWFTERSTAASYAAQYYATPPAIYRANTWIRSRSLPQMDESFMIGMVGWAENSDSASQVGGCGGTYMFSFEENEGYDTDNDLVADGREIVRTVTNSADPQNFTDPDRRQAIYFTGVDSLAMSKQMHYRPIDGQDLFKQFTVECWVMPERIATTDGQTLIERSAAYPANSIDRDRVAIRANFRIGLDPQGRVYGLFDNPDAIESGSNAPVSCQRVTGPLLEANKWYHIALTYNGKRLVLYVNGIVNDAADTSLSPANGVTTRLQSVSGTNDFPVASYVFEPCAFFLGARPQPKTPIALYPYFIAGDQHLESFANYREYFKGYIDEVRCWDGARSSTEILGDYRKRYSLDDVRENRTAVYQVWQGGGTRNNNDGELTLPPELVLHYNFQTLPGASDALYAANMPAGFEKKVLRTPQYDYENENPDLDPSGLYANLAELKGGHNGAFGDPEAIAVGWWLEMKTHSTVYSGYEFGRYSSKYAYVPWIKNTVSRLPIMDGSVIDSFLYSEKLGGLYTPAEMKGINKFVFPNTASPYGSFVYNIDRNFRLWAHDRLSEMLGEKYEPIERLYSYQIRTDFIGTSDLVPMGGAFAKICPEYWDGAASDPWEYTGQDIDANGLPDWWEEYARANYCDNLDPSASLDWDTMVTYHGALMSASQAYIIDLMSGMQPDGSVDQRFASTVDEDGDNLPDWWEDLFGIRQYGANDDPDKDGLSNYAEYILSFGPAPYGMVNGFPFLNPLLARTGYDQQVVDYFLSGPTNVADVAANLSPNEYLGEIATDHDFMEDWWEKQYNVNYSSLGVYDPNDDKDEDGWSNFAECRAFTWRGSYAADLIDRFLDGHLQVLCYPTPAIGVRITYHGVQDISGAGLVVRTYTGTSPRVDATFMVNGSAGEVQTGTRVLGGFFGEAKLHGFLNPGCVVPGSGIFSKTKMTSNQNYRWTDPEDQTYGVHTGTYEEYLEALLYNPNIEIVDSAIEWEQFATMVSDTDGHYGEIYYTPTNSASRTLIGKIDYRTGEYSIDLGLVVAGSGESLDGCVFRVDWTYRIGENWPQAIWVSEATKGRVREGVNTVEAFIDLDGNGQFTEGEPYGMLQNVMIGWHKTPELVIEVKDSSSVIARTEIEAVADANAGAEGGEAAADPVAQQTIKVTVRRKEINGQNKIEGKTIQMRSIPARTVVLDDRPYITEADILTIAQPGLDWKWLVKDAKKLGLKDLDSELISVGYDIEQVVTMPDGSTSNLVISSFVNTFGTQRAIPTLREPIDAQPVYSARPTFRFVNNDETMKAYRLQVWTSTNMTEMVYDSGVTVLPGRTGLTAGTSVYAVTPDLYAGCCVSTNGSAIFNDNTNYFWRVALLNAKYNESDDDAVWSKWGEFQMDVANVNRHPMIPTGYGNVAASVRYFGTARTSDLTNLIVVEAFENADFTGAPAARMRVADTASISDYYDLTTTNVALRGIAPGDYYLRAYADLNNNGVRDNWEPWGYANYVGTDAVSIYTPADVTVTDEMMAYPSVTIYIEDCDTNKNEIPDCSEPKFFSVEEGQQQAALGTDSDDDGLSDTDEDSFGTDKDKQDSDNDGMPDGWEALYADLDPNFPDADEAADGDVMAFAVTNATVITVRNTTEGATAYKYILAEGSEIPFVGDSAEGLELYSMYEYPVIENGKAVKYVGRGGRVELTAEAGTENRVAAVSTEQVAYVHAQVYAVFGFNPLTAVAGPDAVNTKPFTALDKYLVVRYLESLGICDEKEVNIKNLWKNYTLKPYNTDLDEDGVSDGWELYVMFGPNEMNATTFTNGTAISPWKYGDRASDNDGDTLENYKEYNRGLQPTDPWNKYTVRDELFKSELLTGDPEEFDYLTDAVAKNFGVTPDKYYADDDFDQVHALGEMLGYYLDPTSLADIDLTKAFSDGVTPDYFRSFTDRGVKTYLGKRFNAAEFIEIEARAALGMDALQGAGTASMATGWDYWSAARYGYANTTSNATEVVSDDGAVTTEVWTVEHDFSGKIMPTMNLTLRYAGNDTLAVIVEAFQVNPTFPENGTELQATWNVTAEFSGGIAQVTLAEPTAGSLKQGAALFRAYVVGEAEGGAEGGAEAGAPADAQAVEFSYEMTYGTTETTVGWKGGDISIQLGDKNEAFPVIPLVKDDEVYQLIGFVRTKKNGKEITPKGVLLRKYWNNVNRDCVYPEEWMLREDPEDPDNKAYEFIGLDKMLVEDFDLASDPTTLESVTYEIVRLTVPRIVDGETGALNDNQNTISVTNLNHYTVQVVNEETGEITLQTVDQQVNEEFTIHYSLKRDRANNVIGTADSLVGDTMISFTIPTDGFIYTRFWIEVDGAEFGDEGGFPLTGVARGRKTLDLEELMGSDLDVGIHQVRILLGNDKFGGPDTVVDEETEWSEIAEFSVNSAKNFNGKLDVQVIHPILDSLDGITVAVYESEDLVNPVKIITGQTTGVTNTISGLRENGSYYVAAWAVKNPDDGRANNEIRRPYDAWGYVTRLGETEYGFEPRALLAKLNPSETATVYLQDTDWNDNGIYDRDEDFYEKYGIFNPVAPEFGEIEDPLEGAKDTDDEEPDSDGDDVPDTDDEDPVLDNGGEWLERDVMAYATAKGYLVYIGTGTNKNDAAWYWVSDYLSEDTKLSPTECPIRNGEPAENITSLMSTYYYGKKKQKLFGIGTNVTFQAGSGFKVINTADSSFKDNGYAGYGWQNIVFVHAQVYSKFGFNSNTANGWIPRTEWVNSKNFTKKDKTYVADYLLAVGAITNKKEIVTGYKQIDQDADGVLDGWELYTMFGNDDKGAPAYCRLAAAPHSPWNYDDRETDADSDTLTQYQEYDGGYHPTDPYRDDTDKDGIKDAMAFKYHIKGAGAMDDQDGDGLCNYVEYLLSEVFTLGVTFDPDNAFSVDPYNIDYFYQIGSLYAGEIFTDNDMVEDAWEDLVGAANANRYAWDQTADNDDDGWTNFDERRYRDFAAADPNNTNALLTTGVEGHPTPTLKVTFFYNGKQLLTGGSAEAGMGEETTGVTNAPVILQTYTDADLIVPDAVYTATPTESFHSGRQTLEFTTPGMGYVKSGKNSMIAFIDLDGNGVYTPGEPLGYARGVNVGWYSTSTEIEMTDVSPIITRADLTTGESDRHVLYGSEDGDNRNLYSGGLSGGKYERIRVIRTLVNGWGVDQLNIANRVIVDKWLELDQRPFFFEGDVLGDNVFDLDWELFDREVLRNTNVISAGIDPTNVTYRIVLGNGTIDTSATNNLFSLATVKHYDLATARTRPTPIAPGSESSIVYASHPTFKWSMGGINSYTAFRLQIRSGSSVIWDSGLRRTPPMASDGTYTYEAEAYVGEVLANNQNYSWRVSMYNAKFQSDYWSQGDPTFQMSAPTDGYVLGKIPVCVKYFGPKAALGISTVRVAAYATPDFSGTPVSRTVATTTNIQTAKTAHKVNATLMGLPKGRYYVCAYLDANTYGKPYDRDAFESWGYACPREKDLVNPYKPYTILVDDTGAVSEVIDVYIEDADTNGNSLPDLWEYAANGGLYEGTQAIDGVVPGNAAIKASLTANLQDKVNSTATTGGLTAMLTTVMSSREVAALAMGVEPTALSVNAAGAVTVESEVDSVTISSIGFEDGKLVIQVDGTQKELATGLYGQLETAPTEVTCVVYHKDTLEADWSKVKSEKVTIGADAQAIELPEDNGTSGFYKVVIEQ